MTKEMLLERIKTIDEHMKKLQSDMQTVENTKATIQANYNAAVGAKQECQYMIQQIDLKIHEVKEVEEVVAAP